MSDEDDAASTYSSSTSSSQDDDQTLTSNAASLASSYVTAQALNRKAAPPDSITADLGLLAAFDPAPTRPEAFPGLKVVEIVDKDEAKKAAPAKNKAKAKMTKKIGKKFALEPSVVEGDRQAVQFLVNELFALPRRVELDDKQGSGRAGNQTVKLPPALIRLPRAKPLPVPREETKWEAFAKSKGIVKHKRDRLVYDEPTETYLPRYGGRRSVSNAPPILELKQTDGDHVDPFERRNDEKKMVSLKQKQRELKNAERQQKRDPKRRTMAAREELDDVLRPDFKRGLKRSREALKSAQTATASYGRFDPALRGEPARQIQDKRRKFAPNASSKSDIQNENQRSLKILERLH